MKKLLSNYPRLLNYYLCALAFISKVLLWPGNKLMQYAALPSNSLDEQMQPEAAEYIPVEFAGFEVTPPENTQSELSKFNETELLTLVNTLNSILERQALNSTMKNRKIVNPPMTSKKFVEEAHRRILNSRKNMITGKAGVFTRVVEEVDTQVANTTEPIQTVETAPEPPQDMSTILPVEKVKKKMIVSKNNSTVLKSKVSKR